MTASPTERLDPDTEAAINKLRVASENYGVARVRSKNLAVPISLESEALGVLRTRIRELVAEATRNAVRKTDAARTIAEHLTR